MDAITNQKNSNRVKEFGVCRLIGIYSYLINGGENFMVNKYKGVCNNKTPQEIEEIVKEQFPDFPIDLLVLCDEYVKACFCERSYQNSEKSL